MKRLLNQCLSMTLLASLFLVTSCGEDPVEPVIEAPTVSGPTESEKTVNVGEAVSFKVNVTAPGGFNTFMVDQTIEGEETEEIALETKTPGTTPTTFEYNFTFTPTAAMAGKEIIFDFVAVDEENLEGKFTYTLNVNEIPFNEYETVLLGGQSNTTVESFYNVLENKKYFYTDANKTENRDKIDFLYHFGETNKNIIASPDDSDSRDAWANSYNLPLTNLKNSTRFKRVPTSVSYESITTNAQLVNAYKENNPNPEVSRLTQLQEGETFLFMLDDERGKRYGVVKVSKVLADTGVGGANRTITLKIKAQATNNN